MCSGLATVVAASRTGVRIFWAGGQAAAAVRAVELAPILLLLACGLALSVQAGPVMRYLGDTAQALHTPSGYIEEVLR
jgi:multicomponent K+:H+ antiporter subunit D